MSAGLTVALSVDRVTARSSICLKCDAQPFEPCRRVLGVTADGLNGIGDLARIVNDPSTKWCTIYGETLATFHADRYEQARYMRTRCEVSR